MRLCSLLAFWLWWEWRKRGRSSGGDMKSPKRGRPLARTHGMIQTEPSSHGSEVTGCGNAECAECSNNWGRTTMATGGKWTGDCDPNIDEKWLKQWFKLGFSQLEKRLEAEWKLDEIDAEREHGEHPAA